jgi:hypothetical protein
MTGKPLQQRRTRLAYHAAAYNPLAPLAFLAKVLDADPTEATEGRVGLLREGVDALLDLLDARLGLKESAREQIVPAIDRMLSFMFKLTEFEAVGAGYTARRQAFRRSETKKPAAAKKKAKVQLRTAIQPYVAAALGRDSKMKPKAILAGMQPALRRDTLEKDSPLTHFADLKEYTQLEHIRAVKAGRVD